MSQGAQLLRSSGAGKPRAARVSEKSNAADDAEELEIGGESYKIQIKLSAKQKERLFDLRKQTGVESAAQVVRDALRVYEFLVEEVADGKSEVFLQERDTGEVCRVKLL